MLHPSDVHPQQKSQASLLSLISRHPLMVLGFGWGVLMVFAAFGLATLISPGRKSSQSEVLPAVSSSPETITIPVSSESASAPAPQPTRESLLPAFTTPAQSLGSEEPTDSANSSTLPLSTLGVITLICAGGSFLLTLTLKQASANSTRRRKARRKRRKRSIPSSSHYRSQPLPSPRQRSDLEPRVTILSPDISHPLDLERGQEDLATEMDLRKRRSLSSLLRDLEENTSRSWPGGRDFESLQ